MSYGLTALGTPVPNTPHTAWQYVIAQILFGSITAEPCTSPARGLPHAGRFLSGGSEEVSFY